MAIWKDLFIKSAALLDDKWDELSFNFKKKLGLNGPLQIVTYRTYGSATNLYIKGRVLEDKKIAAAGEKDTILNNLVNMYKRFESDEVPGAEIKVKLGDAEHLVTTDKEGYFVLNLVPEKAIINRNLWHPITVELVNAPIPFTPGLQADAEVMIPPPDAEYGIISDIDDTIVKTGRLGVRNANNIAIIPTMIFRKATASFTLNNLITKSSAPGIKYKIPTVSNKTPVNSINFRALLREPR